MVVDYTCDLYDEHRRERRKSVVKYCKMRVLFRAGNLSGEKSIIDYNFSCKKERLNRKRGNEEK